MIKWLAVAVGLAIVGGLGAAAIWSSNLLKIDLEALEQRYARAESKFMDIDGVRVHYMDEGSGPPVVLLHASFMHLFTWDGLAESLKDDFRVIRLDFLAAGLTGPPSDGQYSYERNLELVHGLTQRLELDEFSLIATSSGGTIGFRYASQYPDRVSRLILINSAGLPRTAVTNPNRVRGTALGRWFASRHQTRGMLRDTLDVNFIEPNEPPEWLVNMNHDMRRRIGARRAGTLMMMSYRTGDPETTLAGVRAPTMIMWGLDNQTVVHLEADVFQHWLTSAPTLKKKYPGVGHYLYLEIPDEFAKDVRAFLSGELDNQLQYQNRVPYEQLADQPGDP